MSNFSVTLKPIVPKRGINSKLLIKAVSQGLDATADAIRKDFKQTTKTWVANPSGGKSMRGLPVFRIRKIPDGREIATVHRVYYFVNHGTRGGPITPRKPGGSLKFGEHYRAKTYVKRIASRGGGKFGPTQFRKGVVHKGSAPREFDRAIVNKQQPQMEVRLIGWLSRAARV